MHNLVLQKKITTYLTAEHNLSSKIGGENSGKKSRIITLVLMGNIAQSNL